MMRFKIFGNLMSLGAIDFGLIVDGSVVMMESIIRHLAEAGKKGARVLTTIGAAAREVVRPIVFAVGIIIIVYLPILSLERVEGKMFRPMALTVVFALIGSLLLCLTLIPVLASFAFRKGTVSDEQTWIIRGVKRYYEPVVQRAIGRPVLVSIIAAGAFLASLILVPLLGTEFIPKLDEGAIALQAWRLPSVSLEESIKSTSLIENVLKPFPEVKTVVSRTGRAEIATDPMGVETSDIYVILKPREQWQTARNKEELIAAMDERLKQNVPGNIFSYSQPIELRVQELIAGVRSDVAVQVYGEDLAQLRTKADEIVQVLSRISGASDVKAEQIAGLPYLRIRIRRDQIARYGINASQVLDAVEVLGGKVMGQVLEGQRRFFLQVRFSEPDRNNPETIQNIKVADSQGRLIPISQLADIETEEGPAQISRENIHRRIAVECNVRGRDLGSFVADARDAIESRVTLPAGYWIEWGGQFENLERAGKRPCHRRSSDSVLDFRAPVLDIQLCQDGNTHLSEYSAGGYGRPGGSLSQRHAVQHISRSGIHSAVRRRGFERGGPGFLY